MRFINPKTDYAFKKIFGSSESKDILISFLNALVYEGKGREEEKRELARKLLARMDNQAIAQITGLSIPAIERLRQEVNQS